MPLVKGPNGLTLSMSDAVAKSLVDTSDEYVYVEEKPAPKPAPPRKRPSKSDG